MDEIGEMPKDAQVKLLRVLEEGEVRPVGSATAVQVDVRLVSASNRPLAELRAERLREDFYFRIATVVIEIPPLRSRRRTSSPSSSISWAGSPDRPGGRSPSRAPRSSSS